MKFLSVQQDLLPNYLLHQRGSFCAEWIQMRGSPRLRPWMQASFHFQERVKHLICSLVSHHHRQPIFQCQHISKMAKTCKLAHQPLALPNQKLCPTWNPAQISLHPRPNSIPCLKHQSKRAALPSRNNSAQYDLHTEKHPLVLACRFKHGKAKKLATKIKMHRAQKSPVQLLAHIAPKKEGGEMPFVFLFFLTQHYIEKTNPFHLAN